MNMAQIAFDTLAYANKLKSVGVEAKVAETQAEIQAKILTDLTNDRLATKDDIRKLENEIGRLRSELIIKLGGIVIACTVVLGTLITILSHIR